MHLSKSEAQKIPAPERVPYLTYFMRDPIRVIRGQHPKTIDVSYIDLPWQTYHLALCVVPIFEYGNADDCAARINGRCIGLFAPIDPYLSYRAVTIRETVASLADTTLPVVLTEVFLALVLNVPGDVFSRLRQLNQIVGQVLAPYADVLRSGLTLTPWTLPLEQRTIDSEAWSERIAERLKRLLAKEAVSMNVVDVIGMMMHIVRAPLNSMNAYRIHDYMRRSNEDDFKRQLGFGDKVIQMEVEAMSHTMFDYTELLSIQPGFALVRGKHVPVHCRDYHDMDRPTALDEMYSGGDYTADELMVQVQIPEHMGALYATYTRYTPPHQGYCYIKFSALRAIALHYYKKAYFQFMFDHRFALVRNIDEPAVEMFLATRLLDRTKTNLPSGTINMYTLMDTRHGLLPACMQTALEPVVQPMRPTKTYLKHDARRLLAENCVDLNIELPDVVAYVKDVYAAKNWSADQTVADISGSYISYQRKGTANMRCRRFYMAKKTDAPGKVPICPYNSDTYHACISRDLPAGTELPAVDIEDLIPANVIRIRAKVLGQLHAC